MRSNDATDCHQLLVDKATMQERVAIAAKCYVGISGYVDRYKAVQKGDHLVNECSNISKQMAEQAYDAECSTRSLLKVGIDSFNLLVDSGTLEESIRQAIANVNEEPRFMEEALDGAEHYL